MSLPPAADSGTRRTYTRSAGTSPLPGYVLIEPLGRGGFGEVWKCEAPGGLHKAVKFVGADEDGCDSQFRQERDAFEQIKAVRHPFLLSLERVEVVDDTLVMVMELADRQLADRYNECRTAGLPGIPRDELLGYLADAAEALDLIVEKFGLQHLDVKPANLFLVSGRVKVGDYGLVSRPAGEGEAGAVRGMTPKYTAPEVLLGSVHPRSDQYSLALVYFELLTGAFPYPGRTSQQLMLQHVTVTPDLAPLPECDREAVARALAKKPEDRFGSCLDFARALLAADGGSSPALAVRRARLDRTVVDLSLPPADPLASTDRYSLSQEETANVTPRVDQPPSTGRPLPRLVAASGRVPAPAPHQPAAPPPTAEKPADRSGGSPAIRLKPIRSVVPVARLVGDAPDGKHPVDDFVSAVVTAAAGGGHVPQLPGDLGRLADGTWVCQFPSTVPAPVVPLKLAVLREQWRMPLEEPEPGRIVLRKAAPGGGGFWGAVSGKKGGLEVVVRLPAPGQSVGEVTVTGAVVGNVDRAFAQSALDTIPKVIADVRRELGNVADRRKHPRLAASFPVAVYPIHSDGRVDPPVPGRCRDVSAGGVAFTTEAAVKTKYAYLAFEGVLPTAGLAILARVVREQAPPLGGVDRVYGCQFRTDL